MELELGHAKNPSEASEGKTVPGSSAGGLLLSRPRAVGCIGASAAQGAAQGGSSHPLVARLRVVEHGVQEGGCDGVVAQPARRQH